MFGLSPLELGIIILVIVLLFGTRRLPELGSGLGKAISNFRSSFKEESAIDVTDNASSANGSEAKAGDKDSAEQRKAG